MNRRYWPLTDPDDDLPATSPRGVPGRHRAQRSGPGCPVLAVVVLVAGLLAITLGLAVLLGWLA